MPRSVVLLAATAFLLMLGLSVLFPVLPFYVRWLDLSELQAGVLMSSYAAVGVVVSPLWGRFSQRLGRKPAIIIGLLGFAVGFGLFGLGSTFAELLGARLLGGLFAAAALPAIFAFVADETAPEQRSTAMGMIGAGIGLGIICGPVVGGLLAPLGLRIPFFVSAAIGLVNAALVALIIREAPRTHDAVATAPLRSLGGLLRPYLVFAFLISTGRVGFEATIGFLIADRLDGGPAAVGGLLGGLGLVGVVVQGGGIRPLVARFGDRRLIVAGTVLVAAGLGVLAWPGGWAGLVLAGLLLAFGYALSTPTFNAELSRRGETNQGAAQGLLNSAQSLGRVAGPLSFTLLYQVRGASVCYGAAALLSLAALAIARRSFAAAPTPAASPT